MYICRSITLNLLLSIPYAYVDMAAGLVIRNIHYILKLKSKSKLEYIHI